MPVVLRARAALGKRRASRVLRAGLDALLAATLAPQCAACDAVLDEPSRGPVCATCWNRIPLISEPPFTTLLITKGVAAGNYDDALREIIHAFKYDRRRGLARPLGRLAAAAGRDILEGADIVVPVPLHPFKRLRRGFNQAEALATQMGLPITRALWRLKFTRSQTGLHAAARRRNVRNAFRLAWWTRSSDLVGRTVVLVDDVRTTGATLDACARVLVDAGVKEVRALTVARAAAPYRQADTAA